ncbi:MAG: twin-arginine translocase TatA/TatE family subunit [Planctomycetes bacterium]|nr:twin-arginine translocase TatA/TatE family subunit [Planctomycetota bacterium]
MNPSGSLDFFLAFFLPGGTEWIMLLVLGLLIFGRRLPEVGRSLGRSIVEFKRGIKGIEEEVEEESSKHSPPQQIEHRSANALDSPNVEPQRVAEPDAPQEVASRIDPDDPSR